ncbi:SBBP repeat-containing protein [Nostoc sp. MG11]|uniref:SBBP repeat-containing protein n=1 Tax=Nostoc sp. MG11 TaxID=2721166 RepID=UPI001868433B|nr:SBBP repeat-containing protein [Nostoc sp. MG11]
MKLKTQTNSNGEEIVVQWKYQVPFSDANVSKGIAVDSQGFFYITGYTWSQLDNNVRGVNAWVAKYNPQGQLCWQHQLGFTRYDVFNDIAVDSLGYVYVTGGIFGQLASSNARGIDVWLAKCDPQGQLCSLHWHQQLVPQGADAFNGIAVDMQGYVYIGYIASQLASSGEVSRLAWVTKYDPQGQLCWQHQLKSSWTDVAEGIAVDSFGYVYITGYTSDQVVGSSESNRNAWIAKYDPHGQLCWQHQLPSSEVSVSKSIAVDSLGYICITGYTYSQLDSSEVRRHAWLAKYDQRGQLCWLQKLDFSSYDVCNDIAVDNQGDIYITGGTFSQLNSNSARDGNTWVAKLVFKSTCPNGTLEKLGRLGEMNK